MADYQSTDVRVQAKQDFLKSMTANVTPLAAVSELIWNGFDAGAQHVKVILEPNELQGLHAIRVSDDGDGIDVGGERLRTDKCTDNAGVEKYSTDIIVSEMQMLGGKDSDGGSRGGERSSGSNQRGGGQSSGGGQQRGNAGAGGGDRGGSQTSRREPVAADAGGYGGFDDNGDTAF